MISKRPFRRDVKNGLPRGDIQPCASWWSVSDKRRKLSVLEGGTFLSSDFTPTRQGGHAVTVELIGARVLVYFDGANCRISGGVLKRGCFPKGEDEKDSWGSVRTWRPLDLWRSNGGVDQLEQESGILGSS